MASAITHPMRSSLQTINAISNTAILRSVSNFRSAHPVLFWLFSPMIIPAASCLVFLSSVILTGIVCLAIFYGILFLMFLPTLMVVLSGPTMLALSIISTCYMSYQGFLVIQRCLRIAKRAPQIASQFYASTLERTVWFLGIENGWNPFTNRHWVNLWNESTRRSQIIRENLMNAPQMHNLHQIFLENYQMGRDKIEQALELFHQVVEFVNGVLAFIQQVCNTIQTIVSIVVMTIQFVVFFPKIMIDSMVRTHRQVSYIITRALEICQSIVAWLTTVTSPVLIALQSIPGYPRRMMDMMEYIYSQMLSTATRIQDLFQRLVEDHYICVVCTRCESIRLELRRPNRI